MNLPLKLCSFTFLVLTTLFLFPPSASAELRVGADWSSVRFPGAPSETGLELRAEWMFGAGLMVTYASYDLEELPQTEFREFSANLIYGYGFPVIQPYSGLGISFSKIKLDEDPDFPPDFEDELSSSDKALNLIQGVHFELGRIVPFVEFRQALYLDDDEIFGFERRRTISAGLLIGIL